MSRDQNVHPEILDGLEYESQFIQNTSGAQRRDVKLDRGDSWLVRYLPAKLGPNGRFYARIAKHWFNMKAVICPRMTEEAFGGDPNAYCAVCDLSDHLNADRNEDVSKFGFKLRGTPNWLTYCAVFEKATKGGNPQQMPMPEVLQPYLHQHYKNTWEELTAYVRQNARRAKDSILDFEKGNDIFLSKQAKGLRLDKQDSTPIFDLNDPKFNEYCDKLLAACKDPTVKMPSEKQMNDFAAKAEEEAENLARGTSRGGRGENNNGRGGRNFSRGGDQEGGGDEDDLPPDDAPPRGGSRYSRQAPPQDDGGDQGQEQAPPRRSAPPAQEAPPARRSAPPQQEAAQQPPRRSAPPAAQTTAAPVRRPAPARAPEPPPQDDPPPGDDQGDPNDQGGGDPNDQGGDPQPPDEQPPVRPSASRTQATRTPPPAPSRQVPPPAPARTQQQPPPAPARGGAPRGGAVANESIDEHEHVPEERNDQAPPTALVDPADDPSNAGAGEEPPPVENARRGGYGNNIRNKIAAANNSARK